MGCFLPPDVESCASEWEAYKRRFQIHLDAKGLHEANGRRKVGQLLKFMGPEHVATYDSFTWRPARPAVEADPDNNIVAVPADPGEDQYDLDHVFAKFDSHFGVHRYRNIKRQEFLSTTRRKDQTIMNFISDLRTKAKHCNYGELEEGIIIDMIINKANDSRCTEKLMELEDDSLTLNNVIRICRQVELTQAHVKALESKNQGENQVHRAQAHRRGRSHDRSRGRRRGSSGHMGYQSYYGERCKKCCRSHGSEQCRADNEFCGACGQKGHFKRSPLCTAEKNTGRGNNRGFNRGFARGGSRGRSRNYPFRGRGQRRVHYADGQGHYDEQYDDAEYYDYGEMNDRGQCVGVDHANAEMNEMFDMFDTWYCDVDVLKTDQGVDHDDFYVTMHVGHDPIRLELDTGAKCNIMSYETLESLGTKHELKPSPLFIRGVHGQSQKAIGVVTLPCYYKGVVHYVKFQVLDCNRNVNLLGKDDCVKFGLVARIHNISCSSTSHTVINRYSDVFADEIGCLPGEYRIKIDENVTPVVHPPRQVPVAIRDKVKAELQRMEEAQIIKRVTEPTPWVSSMVAVSKKNSERVRICIDPTDLNRAIQREHFPMNNIDDIVTRLNGSKYFSTLDANMGYFQIKLTEESSCLTTFNTPFGRYRCLRMPMGAKCSAEKFQSALVTAFEGIEGVEIYQDDILVHGQSQKEHHKRLCQVLEKCREINLKLNKKKCQIDKTEVTYVGHRLTGEGLKPTKARVKAITEMRSPRDVKELETILGMVAYVAKFIPRLSDLTAPLRDLKKEESWHWTKKHEAALNRIKAELTSERVLKYYDVKKPLLISVDASCKGLGAAAIQEDRVVAYASRTLTETEKNYAQIEKEMLAVVYGCTKFHKLIYGKNDVTVESDHKPLETLLKKPMNAAPMRIQRMRLKLEPYTFKLIHTSGKAIGLADCLSRLPQDQTEEDKCGRIDEELMVCKSDTIAHPWHAKIEEATRTDKELQAVKQVIFHGWPENKCEVPDEVLPYWNVRDELSAYNGIVFKGERIVIPQSLRGELLQILHQSHTGIVKTKQRARERIYWPGLNAQIEDMVNKCSVCLETRPNQTKEPMTIHPIPALPWTKVGTDLFEFDKVNYLLMVDYYSNYIEVFPLPDTKATTVIKHMKMCIARYGIMETLMSDNGPQFISSEFSQFVQKYKINHITSSPGHQQSNGLAEEGVKQIKALMEKCQQSQDDFALALLDLRNTPRDDLLGSPMQRLHGRRAQTSLPTTDNLLHPFSPDPTTVHDRMLQYRRKQKLYYDRGTQPLKPIRQDTGIRVKTPKGWKPAQFIKEPELPNSYMIKAGEHGRVYRRNRKHLMTTRERPHTIDSPLPFMPPTPVPDSQIPPWNARRRPPISDPRPPDPVRKPVPPDLIRTPRPAKPTYPPHPDARVDTRNSPSPPTGPQNATKFSIERPSRARNPPVWMKDYTN